MRYFFKQYWRYIAMALAFATFNFLINACDVHAQTLISSGTLGYYNESNQRIQTIYSGSGMWINQGRGYLTFNIVIYNRHTNTSQMTPILRQVKATSGGKDYICQIGTTSISYSDSYEDMVGNAYTIICDMEMGSTGLNELETIVEPTPTNTYWLITSQLATFDTNLEIDIASRLTAGVEMLNNKMSDIITAINQTRIDLANTINSDVFQILQSIASTNSKLDKIIEQNKVCTIYDKNKAKANKYISTTGEEIGLTGTWGATDYIPITKNSTINMLRTINWSTSTATCFYNINKTYISCTKTNELQVGNITVPTNASFIRITIDMNANLPQFDICNTAQDTSNIQNEQIIQGQNDINNSINSDDTTGGSNQANDFFNNFDEGDTGTLMDIVSLPLDFLNSLNNTCQPISITIPYFDETFNLPCLRTYLNNKFPTIVTLITLLINGLLCYRVLKAFVELINKLKDPNNDDIEVMDL